MNFQIEAIIECSKCKKARLVFEAGIVEQNREDFSLPEFEDAAVEFFQNYGWVKFAGIDRWLCPLCWEART